MTDLSLIQSRRILLDCDDVLLDWLPGFRRFATEELGIVFNRQFPRSFNITEWLGASSLQEMVSIVSSFNTGAGTGFDQLGPIPGAVEAMQTVKKLGYELHIITSCSGLEDVHSRRWINIEKVFGTDVFDSLTCLELGVSKHDALSAHPPSLWIDDLLKNAVVGQKAGHVSAVLQAHHNADAREETKGHGIAWMSDWSDALQQMLPERSLAFSEGP